jgi:lipoprotein-releasing system ATP-binding protein
VTTPPTTLRPPAPAAVVPGQARTVLACAGVRKSFALGSRSMEILHGVSVELGRGELVALVGESGAGKSTLLHVLGLLERPSEGEVELAGASAWDLPDSGRAALRNRTIGFVFQFYHLLPELDALENVLLPAMISDSFMGYSRRRKDYVTRATEALARFGMSARLEHRPAQLSGGERQRVAIARALFHDPPILLADEPTGNLDSATGEKVLELLFEEQARRGLSMILVTHDERIAARCQRILHMEDGLIAADTAVLVPD